MRVLLMHPDRDFDLPAPPPPRDRRFDWGFERLQPWRRHATHRDRDVDPRPLPPHESALVQDLELDTLVRAMAGPDGFLFEVARHALLSGVTNDVETILYRQGIVGDCLRNSAAIRGIYALAVGVLEASRKHLISSTTRYPASTLYQSIEALEMLAVMLRKVRDIANLQAGRFESKGFTALFARLREEFSDEYFARIETHLTDLKFRQGVLLSAALGEGNGGTDYVLRQMPDERRSWLDRLLHRGTPDYTFYIDARDEAGARALSELRDRGINLVANALAQSTDHILSFFDMLCTELAFYIGCLNVHDTLAALGAPICLPQPEPAGGRRQRCSGLYDVCLALRLGRTPVGNALDADGKNLVIITGANQGGKSTFLRGIGLAQLMMQCGMFVPANSFVAELSAGVFTHYRREEDATMTHGKLDEELARLSEIIDAITPNAMLLVNESFASTNEREGSEIARQVVRALLEKGIKVFVVTHLYKFARGMFEHHLEDAEFLRAERQADGTRTFRILEGEPLETSYGEDLYREVFGTTPENGHMMTSRVAARQQHGGGAS